MDSVKKIAVAAAITAITTGIVLAPAPAAQTAGATYCEAWISGSQAKRACYNFAGAYRVRAECKWGGWAGNGYIVYGPWKEDGYVSSVSCPYWWDKPSQVWT